MKILLLVYLTQNYMFKKIIKEYLFCDVSSSDKTRGVGAGDKTHLNFSVLCVYHIHRLPYRLQEINEMLL